MSCGQAVGRRFWGRIPDRTGVNTYCYRKACGRGPQPVNDWEVLPGTIWAGDRVSNRSQKMGYASRSSFGAGLGPEQRGSEELAKSKPACNLKDLKGLKSRYTFGRGTGAGL